MWRKCFYKNPCRRWCKYSNAIYINKDSKYKGTVIEVLYVILVLDSEYPDRPGFLKGDSNMMSDLDLNDIQLTTNMEMLSIARAMSAPDSGLEVKNRTWLKITIPNAFLGKFNILFFLFCDYLLNFFNKQDLR